MFFTIEDLRKIERWLRQRTVRDSELPVVSALTGDEYIPIVQNGENKIIRIRELVKQLSCLTGPTETKHKKKDDKATKTKRL